ncbi:MAG: phosphatase PAP2 family protein [Acidobacteriota bacterium]|nr:phosphatase PAP2 family protein [Acidobacteriota bacterium]
MDSILNWNEAALEANRVSHTDGSREQNGPTLSSRALAIVHLAMYDAFAGVVNTPSTLPHYITPDQAAPPNTDENRAAAIAGAAYKTLMTLYPSQKKYLNIQLQLLGKKDSVGHIYGEHVADKILLDRSEDPSASRGNYEAPKVRGKHQQDPDNYGQGFHGPLYGGKSKGFAISKRHTLDDPPFDDGKDPKYLDALRQVRARGIKPELMGTLPDEFEDTQRTPEETIAGIYWGYDGAIGLGTPPRLYNQIVKKIAIARNNTEEKNARLFALINAAMGDAGILAWDEKYLKNFWRPVVGIREHDNSFGTLEENQPMPAGETISEDADPQWLPLGAPSSNSANQSVMTALTTFPFANVQFGRVKNSTPPFPAYPSGHATFGAAAFHITRLFYDNSLDGSRKADNLLKKTDGTDIFFISEEFDGLTQDNNGTIRSEHRRIFKDGLWGMIIENGLSRVYLGVHWSFDAFAVKGSKKNPKPDLSNDRIGGVGLGLRIAEDIFKFGGKKAPKKSTVLPRT